MRHIFVVDDERNIRDLIRKYLEKEGFAGRGYGKGLWAMPQDQHLMPLFFKTRADIFNRSGEQAGKQYFHLSIS